MGKSHWNRENCYPGRSYMLGKDIQIKYEDHETIIEEIRDALREFVLVEPAVRLCLDNPKSNPERAILAIPFQSCQEKILTNLAMIIYQSLMGYYISAEPQSSHFGITNLLIEGNRNSLLKREVEKQMTFFQNRGDMAARLLAGVKSFRAAEVPKAGTTYMDETIRQGLDIHLGYRIHVSGESVNTAQIFIPIRGGSQIINQIYCNLEQMVHQNFVTYDESGNRYLNITDTLVFRELETILSRSRNKENTRKKILNNLLFDTFLTDKEEISEQHCGDQLYDQLNKTDDENLRLETERSGRLYGAFSIRTSEKQIKVSDQFLHKLQESVDVEKATETQKEEASEEQEPVSEEPKEEIKVEAAEEEAVEEEAVEEEQSPVSEEPEEELKVEPPEEPKVETPEEQKEEKESAASKEPEELSEHLRVPAPDESKEFETKEESPEQDEKSSKGKKTKGSPLKAQKDSYQEL